MESPEHERRSVSEYVEIEASETVKHAEKLAEERIGEDEYQVWDVQTDEGRWWVVTNPTNLYQFDDYKSMDHVLSFHVGLTRRVFARQSREAPADEEERYRLAVPWRKWEQAAEALGTADEAEDFQAIAMRCRESLLAFVKDVADPSMIPAGEEPPKGGDFVHWTEAIARHVTPNSPRLRRYLQKTAAATWELVNWLTHEKNAIRFDAHIAVQATSSTLMALGMALVRHERGEPSRCPDCGSYRVVGDWRSEPDAYVNLCEVCGWEAEREDSD